MCLALRFFLILLLCGSFGPPLALAGPLRAAVVKREITPRESQWLVGYGPRRSEGVHDSLYHRILVLDDGRRPFVLVSSDLGAFSPSVFDRFCGELKRRTGVEEDQIWWSVTHTHAGPELGPYELAAGFFPERFQHEWDRDYAGEVQALLMDRVEEALKKLQPARLRIGTATALANTNRRARTPEGKIVLGINPYGPVDRQIGLIRLERPDGSPLALVANYAMHGTVLGAVKQISGDAPGIVASYVEEQLGAPLLYVNGAAADVGPLYFFQSNFRRLPEFKVLLGDPILQADRSLLGEPAGQVELKHQLRFVETPMKPGLDWPEALSAYQRRTPAGERQVRIPVRFLRLSQDTVLWSAPLELFSQIAQQVRQASPFSHTFYFGYTNGWLGYLPTAAAFAEGGYEIGVTPYTPRAESDLLQAVIDSLQRLFREETGMTRSGGPRTLEDE